jgi:hypothetical protein
MSNKQYITKTLAPEDIRVGAYVTVLQTISEFLPHMLCVDDGIRQRSVEPVRVRWLPCEPTPPMKVKAVCLPHVFVRCPNREHRTLDVREQIIGEVPRDYAQTVVDAIRARHESMRKRDRRSRKKG